MSIQSRLTAVERSVGLAGHAINYHVVILSRGESRADALRREGIQDGSNVLVVQFISPGDAKPMPA